MLSEKKAFEAYYFLHVIWSFSCQMDITNSCWYESTSVKVLRFSFFPLLSPPFLHLIPLQTKWSGLAWTLCQGFGWPTGGSSLSWRAPPGPQIVAGAVCCAVDRWCLHRASWSIWCPEVCVTVCCTHFYLLVLVDFSGSSPPVPFTVLPCISLDGGAHNSKGFWMSEKNLATVAITALLIY